MSRMSSRPTRGDRQIDRPDRRDRQMASERGARSTEGGRATNATTKEGRQERERGGLARKCSIFSAPLSPPVLSLRLSLSLSLSLTHFFLAQLFLPLSCPTSLSLCLFSEFTRNEINGRESRSRARRLLRRLQAGEEGRKSGDAAGKDEDATRPCE